MSVDQAWDDFFDIPSQTATVSSALLHTLVVSAGIQRVHTPYIVHVAIHGAYDYISKDANHGLTAANQRRPSAYLVR